MQVPATDHAEKEQVGGCRANRHPHLVLVVPAVAVALGVRFADPHVDLGEELCGVGGGPGTKAVAEDVEFGFEPGPDGVAAGEGRAVVACPADEVGLVGVLDGGC